MIKISFSSVLVCLLFGSAGLAEGITWPESQILPSFSAPAENLQLIDVSGSSNDEKAMFAALKGLVNKKAPRIFSFSGGDEGKFNWLQSLELPYTEATDKWALLSEYRDEIAGIVVYDAAVPDALNLATTAAALSGGIIAPASLADRLTQAPYNFPILADFRGQFTTKLEVYEYLYAHYWPQTTHRVLGSLNPGAHYGVLRSYLAAIGAAVVWLDPREPEEKALLGKFLGDMPPGSGVTIGWWPEEASGIREASDFGLSTCASDWSENLTVFSGMSRRIAVKRTPPKPDLANKIYITLIMSDGDNLQYCEHRMKNLWDGPNRGEIPLGWTVSPVMADAMPSVLDYYYRTATENDCFISGPSGVGYTYPNYWTNPEYLAAFVGITNDYMMRTGLRVVTIWNTITGGISDETGRAFADNGSAVLGITGMAASGSITIYNNTLPGQALNATYCYNLESLIYEIDKAIAGFAGDAPRFVSIQANPWQSNYQDLRDAVAHYAGNSDIIFIRPDNYFQLMRESLGLPVETEYPVSIGAPAVTGTILPMVQFDPATGIIRIMGNAPNRWELYTLLGERIGEF